MKIITATLDKLSELSGISIAFEVTAELVFTKDNSGCYNTTLRALDRPYLKDYDAIPGNKPEDWLRQFDTRNWGLILAKEGDEVAGACLLAWKSPGVDMLEGRDDLAVLWDLRVDPLRRGKGIGTMLFKASTDWARSHGATELKIETQNNNVQAVKFYQKQGCRLMKVIPGAYPDFPDEAMLLFYVSVS